MGTVKVHSHTLHNNMNALVILAVLGFACGAPQHHGGVGDTAEVAAAKARFFQTYNAQAALARAASPQQATYVHQQPRWTGAMAHTVPASVNVHHAAVPVQARWTGPMAATVPAGVHGAPMQVAQTADVAAATQAHFAAHQHALRATG